MEKLLHLSLLHTASMKLRENNTNKTIGQNYKRYSMDGY
jgi:hypothetical protein